MPEPTGALARRPRLVGQAVGPRAATSGLRVGVRLHQRARVREALAKVGQHRQKQGRVRVKLGRKPVQFEQHVLLLGEAAMEYRCAVTAVAEGPSQVHADAKRFEVGARATFA